MEVEEKLLLRTDAELKGVVGDSDELSLLGVSLLL